MPLKIETTPLPGSRLEIRLQADAEEIEKAYDRVFSRLQQEAHIPGFRPGKAPRALIERRFDAASLRRLAWQDFLEKSYLPSLEELKIEPYGEPELPDLEEWEGFQRGQDLEMAVTWTIRPRPELPDYMHLKLVKPSAEVSDEDLEEQLQALRSAHARQQPTDREIVEEGDAVTAHVVVYAPDSEAPEDETDIELVAEKESPDQLKQAVIGAAKGQSFESTLQLGEHTLSHDLPEGLRRVQIRVDAIEERVLPALDADFAKVVDDSLESVEALRDYVRERLVKQRQQDAERMVREVAFALVDAGTKLDLPAEMINQAASGEIRRYTRDMISSGVSVEAVRELLSDRESGLAESLYREVISDLRSIFIEHAIAEAENLEVTEEDVERAMSDYAQVHGIDLPTLRQMVDLQTSAQDQFEERARHLKIGDLLIANAQIEEVPWEAFPLRARRLLEEAIEQRRAEPSEPIAGGEEPALVAEALQEESAEEENTATADAATEPAGQEE